MGKRSKKHLTVVAFDKEIVTKSSADKVIANVEGNGEIGKDVLCKSGGDSINSSVWEKKSKKKRSSAPVNEQITNLNGSENGLEVKVKRKKTKGETNETQVMNDVDFIGEVNESEDKIKRKKKKQAPVAQTPVEIIETPESIVENGNKSLEDKIKRKKKKQVPVLQTHIEMIDTEESIVENGNKSSEDKIKRKKKKPAPASEILQESVETEEPTVENANVKKGESIRAQKRKKHLKLLEDKRLKVDLTTQQSALNYLSKWKHCRNEWKFEKLKQIWLQQNLFDTSKLPNEFWETVIEYFSCSKGFIRNVILRDALKIIDKEENTEEENTDENYVLVVQRARDVVQSLQE